MLNIFGHKGNANQKDIEILPHSNQNGWCQCGQEGTLIYCWLGM
jgi:hypothetical protein